MTSLINRRAESEFLAARALESIAGGVVSLNRKTDPPISFVRGLGSRVWDADGNEYLDYHAAFAPHVLGHNDPGVNAAVKAAVDRGDSLMGCVTACHRSSECRSPTPAAKPRRMRFA
jgi:glutamate-1-semialdehyde 2,1-aminomutase